MQNVLVSNRIVDYGCWFLVAYGTWDIEATKLVDLFAGLNDLGQWTCRDILSLHHGPRWYWLVYQVEGAQHPSLSHTPFLCLFQVTTWRRSLLMSWQQTVRHIYLIICPYTSQRSGTQTAQKKSGKCPRGHLVGNRYHSLLHISSTPFIPSSLQVCPRNLSPPRTPFYLAVSCLGNVTDSGYWLPSRTPDHAIADHRRVTT